MTGNDLWNSPYSKIPFYRQKFAWPLCNFFDCTIFFGTILGTKKQCKFKILDGKQGVLWFLKIRPIKRVHVCIFIDSLKAAIDRFHSRGQQLCKLLGIKESFNMSEFKAHRIFLGTQTWPPIHCFVHKFGRRDLMWKRSIDNPLSWKFLYIVFSPIILLFLF